MDHKRNKLLKEIKIAIEKLNKHDQTQYITMTTEKLTNVEDNKFQNTNDIDGGQCSSRISKSSTKEKKITEKDEKELKEKEKEKEKEAAKLIGPELVRVDRVVSPILLNGLLYLSTVQEAFLPVFVRALIFTVINVIAVFWSPCYISTKSVCD